MQQCMQTSWWGLEWIFAGCIFVRPGLPALQRTGSHVKHGRGPCGDPSESQCIIHCEICQFT